MKECKNLSLHMTNFSSIAALKEWQRESVCQRGAAYAEQHISGCGCPLFACLHLGEGEFVSEAHGEAGTPLQKLATAAGLCGITIVKMKLLRSQRERISALQQLRSLSHSCFVFLLRVINMLFPSFYQC